MSKQVKKGLGDPAITPSVSGSNLAQSGEDFRLPPFAPAHRLQQTDVIGRARPSTWEELERNCRDTFGGGHRSDGKLDAYRHGMTTVFNVLRAEFPTMAQCKAAPDLLAALQAFEKVDDFSGWHPNYSDAIEAARAAIVKATK